MRYPFFILFIILFVSCSEEIPIIEGMVIIDNNGKIGDTIGIPDKVGLPCEEVPDYDIIGYPNILFKGDKITFNLFNPAYYKLKLEKARIGEHLLQDLEFKYVADFIPFTQISRLLKSYADLYQIKELLDMLI